MGHRSFALMLTTFLTATALAVVVLLPTAAADSPGGDFPTPQPLQDPQALLQLPQVGDDVDQYLRFPIPQPPGQVKQLAVTDTRVCALTHGGLMYCWQFGVEDELEAFTGMLAAVTAGTRHFCALDSTSRAVCWDDPAATEVPDPPLADIAAGHAHSCAVTTTGQAVCWGRNLDADHRNPPGGPFQHIDAGGDNTCATSAWEGAKCWGGGDLPAEPFDHPVAKLAVSSNIVCGIDGANRPHCAFAPSTSAFEPPATMAMDIAAGRDFACTLDTTGSLVCEGDRAPDLPDGPVIATVIEAGEDALCAVTPARGIQCWDETGQILGY